MDSGGFWFSGSSFKEGDSMVIVGSEMLNSTRKVRLFRTDEHKFGIKER